MLNPPIFIHQKLQNLPNTENYYTNDIQFNNLDIINEFNKKKLQKKLRSQSTNNQSKNLSIHEKYQQTHQNAKNFQNHLQNLQIQKENDKLWERLVQMHHKSKKNQAKICNKLKKEKKSPESQQNPFHQQAKLRKRQQQQKQLFLENDAIINRISQPGYNPSCLDCTQRHNKSLFQQHKNQHQQSFQSSQYKIQNPNNIAQNSYIYQQNNQQYHNPEFQKNFQNSETKSRPPLFPFTPLVQYTQYNSNNKSFNALNKSKEYSVDNQYSIRLNDSYQENSNYS
ncbi:hypothetical protein PPERSA_02418 [Pseudocohnilembus persalinus]|uniref:Uncharacterized protein n=1 Tax=Pseudocohnilembus persalinus TaxID=266149 RepID=A0A0V0QAX9_PSEPJ|nr:hypothetical protein PPERSA_02418 [Pseudocohnilembus persalinus]|eukprot:KRW99306.1 hypothetical protein PPERSA_02418 [Pseudocohnilembus persalinus]